MNEAPAAPAPDLRLGGPWPNPGNPALGLELSQGGGHEVRLTLHDPTGRRVADLWRGPVGDESVRFTFRPGDGSLPDLPSGVYFVRAEGGGSTVTRKWVLLR